jgi:hypothetical protein
LRGFIRGLANVTSAVRIRAVDLDPSEEVEVLGAHLVREILTSDRLPAVGYRQSRRTAPRAASSRRAAQPFDLAGPLLIVGGAADLVEPLALGFSALTPAPILALVVAREPARDTATLWAAKRPDSTIHRASFSIRDAAAMNELIDDWEHEHAPMSAVILARGALDRPRATESALEHFDRVVGGQVAETLSLLNLPGVRSCPTIVLASRPVDPQGNGLLVDDVAGALNDTFAAWLADRGKRHALSIRIASTDPSEWPPLIWEELARESQTEPAVLFDATSHELEDPNAGSDEP